MAIGIQNFQTLFQTYYGDGKLDWLVPDNLPFLNMIEKVGELSGDIIDHPFLYGTPQGYSIDFNTAMQQASNPARAARAMLRCSQAYAAVEFFDKDRALSEGDAAYADVVTTVLTGKIMDFNNQLDLDLHAGGTGWRGTVGAVAGGTNPVTGATLGTNQIFVTSALGLEAVFNQDQQIQAVAYSGYTPPTGSIFPPADGRTPTSTSNPVQITAVDAMARTLTLTDASAFTAGVYIVQSGGAIGFNTSNLYGGIIGMDAWNPYGGVTGSDLFCGLNRSIYPTKLAGYTRNFQNLSIEDAIKRGSAVMSQGGARTTNIGLLNPLDFDALDSKMGTNVRYGTVSTATYGFDSIVINGAAGRMDMVSDPHMPQGFVRLIDPTTWKLCHKFDIPHIVDVESRTMEQGANFDGRTARLRFYGQLRCMAPHKNGIFRLPQVAV